jgi:hypothetical protein
VLPEPVSSTHAQALSFNPITSSKHSADPNIRSPAPPREQRWP